jgi:DNA-binding protein HU-beta
VGQIKKGKVVVIQGLFKAQIVQKKARDARNPRTGETIKVPAKKAIHLKKANSLKL